MDKLTMAHEYAKIIMTAMLDGKLEYRKPYEIANEAFAVLDAMLVENAERKITAPDEIPKHERLIPFDESHEHDYIYGRVCACGAVNGAEKEWQPDWSQAPSHMNYFFMNRDGTKYWTVNKPDEPNMTEHVIDFRDCGGDCYSYASSQNYQGNWQDSLRKRPQ